MPLRPASRIHPLWRATHPTFYYEIGSNKETPMTPDQILDIPPRVLTQAQREFYFNQGYILLEKIIGDDWLAKLRDATEELVERSRKVTKSDQVYDLEPDHTPQSPRLRRVSNPVEQHPVFWDYVTKSILADAVADL